MTTIRIPLARVTGYIVAYTDGFSGHACARRAYRLERAGQVFFVGSRRCPPVRISPASEPFSVSVQSGGSARGPHWSRNESQSRP